MNQNSAAFWSLDASGLVQKSKKPHFVAERFESHGLKSQAVFKTSTPASRRNAFLEARRLKLARRYSYIRDTLAQHHHRLRTKSMMRGIHLNESIAHAEQNRQTLIEEQVRKSREAVTHARKVAELQALRRAIQAELLCKSLEDRLYITPGLSQRLKCIPRSRFVESGGQRPEYESVRLVAATAIQRKWRAAKLAAPIARLLESDLELYQVMRLAFDDVVKLIQADPLIKTVEELFARLRAMTRDRSHHDRPEWKSPARIFLSSYMIAAHPKATMPNVGHEEKALSKAAETMIQSFENWTRGYSTPKGYELALQFSDAWTSYFASFQKWKAEDTRKMIDGMVAHWIELERLWLSVRDQPHADVEWKPKLERQQRQIQSRLAKFGKRALQKLHAQQERIQNEVLGTSDAVDDPSSHSASSPIPVPGAAQTNQGPTASDPSPDGRRGRALPKLSTSPQRFPSLTSTDRSDSVQTSRSSSSQSPSRSPTRSRSPAKSVESAPTGSLTGLPAANPPRYLPTPTGDIPKLQNVVPGFSNELTNEQLAHELILDPNFSLKPPPRSALEEQVRTIAKKAFFDGARREFQRGQFSEYLPAFIADIKQQLLAMVSSGGRIAQEINEALDGDLIQQQINNNVFDIPRCIHYITAKMISLCAPIRDAPIRQIEGMTDLAAVFEKIMDILEDMKVDLANYRLQALRPHLKAQAVSYEQLKFEQALHAGSFTLEKTTAWLETAYRNLAQISAARNPENIDAPENKIRFEDVFHDAMLSIVFNATAAVSMKSVPETLQLDAARLYAYQNEAQALTIVAALVMLAKNIVTELRRDVAAVSKLKEVLFVLLRDPETTIEHLWVQIVATLDSVFAKQSAAQSPKTGRPPTLSSSTGSPVAALSPKTLTPEQKQLIQQMVEKTLSYKDPVYTLLSRRVQSIARAQLTGGVFKRDSLASHGLDIVQTELEELVTKFVLLTKHTKEVHAKYYDDILRKISAEQSPSGSA
ncbi:T-complex protein 11-domain-containing protein [Polychytrium aggregatum]|uniref:T-complex protein 11-domain-containing protein n=1 Tax=Polychytrium aggregatum TaxID=110093 RepID=UPI0022FE525E|nr:T-complex protein 11-domain-containing protein [Polychytrium aggregatum]KAI9207114.1 T-complex protein 11-domain-containing protein [Polychytrium aggregatum]